MSGREQTFLISGMTCAACSARIEKVVSKIDGVEEVRVNLVLETATVVYKQPQRTESQTIIDQISRLGYHAAMPFEADDQWGPSAAEDNHVLRSSGTVRNSRDSFRHAMTLRLIVSAVLSIPFLWLMAGHLLLVPQEWVPVWLNSPWIQLAVAAPVQFIVGWMFYRNSWLALRNRSANMDVLIATGTSAAFFYSVWLTIEQAGHPVSGLAHEHLQTGVYFETSVLLITFVLTGKWLESRAKGRTGEAIRKLMHLQPQTAVMFTLDNQQWENVPLARVRIGSRLMVHPGAQIPADGTVVEGDSSVDESLVTGESVPVMKSTGSMVTGGTVNGNGVLIIQVTKIGSDSTLAAMIRMVEHAQTTKAPVQQLADRWSAIFVPAVLALSLLTFLITLLIKGPGEWAVALSHAIAVLVIACPCALGLATPSALIAGTGRAASEGILFRDGRTLEQMEKIDTIVFDKTGTLTAGKPEVTKWGGFSRSSAESAETEELVESLAKLKAAETCSGHPLAAALIRFVDQHPLALPVNQKLAEWTVGQFRIVEGQGISAVINGKRVIIGAGSTPANQETGLIRIEMTIEDKPVLWFELSDPVRPEAPEAIRVLKEQGYRLQIMSGDQASPVRMTAEAVGIDSAQSGMKPSDKASAIAELQSQGRSVLMTGDGINDAPALAQADVSIAVGGGTDTAMATAGIVLMKPDLLGIVSAFVWGKRTMQIIRQNLFWAFIYNLIGIPAAATGLLEPWMAGAAMALSSVSVVMNSLRLQK